MAENKKYLTMAKKNCCIVLHRKTSAPKNPAPRIIEPVWCCPPQPTAALTGTPAASPPPPRRGTPPPCTAPRPRPAPPNNLDPFGPSRGWRVRKPPPRCGGGVGMGSLMAAFHSRCSSAATSRTGASFCRGGGGGRAYAQGVWAGLYRHSVMRTVRTQKAA